MLLNTYLRMLILEDGKPDLLTKMFGATSGLRARLNSAYGPRLGGRWNTDDDKTPVGDWWQNAQIVRGRVMHAGYVPGAIEAGRARDAAVALDEYVGDRLAVARYRYPMTAYTRLGIPGLSRRGALSARFRRILTDIEPRLDEFWKALKVATDS